MHTIHPVILCGGSGTRLWPKSRADRPKPFIPLVGDETLFRQAIMRCQGDDAFADPMVVAGRQHVDMIVEQSRDLVMADNGVEIIVEPMARNTAPAIALAAHRLDPDAVMLVCPSDQHIADPATFRAVAHKAADLARDGWLVSFGIAPDRPETGYGYIRQGAPLGAGFAVDRFVEKPDLATAQAYLASGEYSWNGGIFAFTAGRYLEELRAYRPEMAQCVADAVASGEMAGALFHPDAAAFARIDGDSIDFAIMENTSRAAMVPAQMGWSDIGNWAALQDALAEGGAAPPAADLIDCENVLVMSDGPRVSAVGLHDICIIVDGDEVLVTTRDGAQKVGKLPGASGR